MFVQPTSPYIIGNFIFGYFLSPKIYIYTYVNSIRALVLRREGEDHGCFLATVLGLKDEVIGSLINLSGNFYGMFSP